MQIKKITPLLVALALASCGGETNTTTEEPADTAAETQVEETQETEEEVKQEEVAKEETKEETKEDSEEIKEEAQEANEDDIYSYVGKTYKNEGNSIDVIKAGRVDQTYKIGPLNLTVYGVMAGRFTEFDEELKSYYDTEDPVDVVTIFYSVENTEDKNINFYVGQSSITTDTKEQIEPDLLAGQEGGGEMLGQVAKEGVNLYYPNNAEDIKEIVWHVADVNDENFAKIAEGIKIKFTFNDKGDQVTAEELK